ncbi:Zn-dependent hydrolase [Streptomyces sp. NPDC005917]|uniref:Zn-dependent hydrolase n=1 Tax=unclassified Streptomyces TaxID=2593676 RepID=UPI003408D3ED
MTSSASDLRVDGPRLLARLEELAAIGADPRGGVTRLAYSAQDVRARKLVAGWMAEAGLATRIDAAGNLLGGAAGTAGLRGALVLGSHLDSVVRGGRLDGPAGVLAAVQAAAALHQSGTRLRHDLIIAAFSNEEGARGTPGMVGSKAVAGLLGEADLARPDEEGVPLAERIRAVGGDPDRIDQAAWDPRDLAGFLELHIEQGPVLEERGARIGVVTAVTGQAKVAALITGAANHAGTTPMARRRDAAVAAAHLVLAVEELAVGGCLRTATTGVMRTGPGVGNVIPGEAVLGIDLRDTEEERITAAIARLGDLAAGIARRTGTTIELRPGPVQAPVATDTWLSGCVAEAAHRRGAPCSPLPSGAGHDAQIMARLGPAAMVFVPSVGGVSHAPAEASRPEDLVLGADVLLHTLLAADRADRADGELAADAP